MPETIQAVCQTLERLAPLGLAESWDNVGFLVGDRQMHVQRVVTCLTITPEVVDEAIGRDADLIVAHHPLPFRPLARITSDSVTGELLWRLIGARVAVYSAHTAFDSAAQGINQLWAESLALGAVQPLVEPAEGNQWGSGRCGQLAEPLPVREVVARCVDTLGGTARPRLVGDPERRVRSVGFACGSGGSFVPDAQRRGCELLVTGEASFHHCLEAKAVGLGLALLGHYQSERFAMERLAVSLAEAFPGLEVWPSEAECDPLLPLRKAD